MNVLASNSKNILSIYFTAGHPTLQSTIPILEQLQAAGVHMVEIGMPYSDPLADGPVIQESSAKALANGMSIDMLFTQLQQVRNTIHIPLVLMGYFNPVLQYGVEKFLQQAQALHINMVILPDMPLHVYETNYKTVFEKYNINNVFLITPNTSEERIRKIDALTNAFIYAVSSASTTGSYAGANEAKEAYFKRIKDMKLKNPVIVGFGINNNETFTQACNYLQGGIIGTAFIKHIEAHVTYENFGIPEFVNNITGV
jgi:tryptophan synthase alpha chain